MSIEERKKDHIRICVEKSVETPTAGFEDVFLINNSLPEMDLREIDTSTHFLGKTISIPLKIAAITGGAKQAGDINRQLAEVAEKRNIIFELGSQRAMIENPSLTDTYCVRDVAPKAFITGNLGIFQLKKFTVKEIREAMEHVGADAVSIHINPAQEAFQEKGDVDFTNLAFHLSNLCDSLPYPVIAKEVGAGICREVAHRLKGTRIKAIDVGGYGGTNWMVIDGLRSGREVDPFATWGIPTAISILESKVGLPIIATGGLRNGVDMAKSIALGADICGMALPFLRVLMQEGKQGLAHLIDKIHRELKIAMFLTGSKNIEELKKVPYVLSGKVKDWAEQRTVM